ncbi:hypothetical protein P8452_25507 [Trifolium repens]|nr:hypothetical protein P8452_25507 [Trifolium repens]
MQFGMDQDIPGEVDVCNNDPWMSDSEPVALVDVNLCIQLCFRQPDVTSRYYDWWKQSKSSPGGDNNTIKVEHAYDLPPPPGFTSKFGINQVEGSDKEGHHDDEEEVVENGKVPFTMYGYLFCPVIAFDQNSERSYAALLPLITQLPFLYLSPPPSLSGYSSSGVLIAFATLIVSSSFYVSPLHLTVVVYLRRRVLPSFSKLRDNHNLNCK